jgi:hypothetical protein
MSHWRTILSWELEPEGDREYTGQELQDSPSLVQSYQIWEWASVEGIYLLIGPDPHVIDNGYQDHCTITSSTYLDMRRGAYDDRPRQVPKSREDFPHLGQYVSIYYTGRYRLVQQL